MANATLLIPSGRQTANFSATVNFPDAAVSGLEKTDFNLRALTENGVNGVDFAITGTEPTQDFTLGFTLPSSAQGSFELSLTGMVTVQGQSSPEAVMANTVVVHYDTTGNVTVTFGTVEYRDGGIVVVPAIFGENVIAPSKSIFEITHVSEDALTDFEYYLVGQNTDFEVVIEVPPDRSGSFQVAVNGDVLLATGTWENVTATAKTVAYSTIVPRLVDYDVPANYTPGENFDVRLAYNVRVTGLSDNNVHQVFLFEGAAETMGTPTPYKWTGNTPPDFEVPVPDDLTGTDWQQLQSPPAGVPVTAENDFDENGFWHGAANEGQYFLIRWMVQEGTTGIFSMTPRRGTVRGPIGS